MFRNLAYKGIFLLFLLIAIPVAFATQYDINTLNVLEKQLYNHNFTNETIEKRLNRVENTVFGRIYEQDTDSRLERLSNLNKNVSRQDSPSTAARPNITPKPDVGYPAVTQLELQLFQQAFIKDDIYSRLSRLEQRAFGSIFSNENLSDRLDRLQSATSNIGNNEEMVTQNYQTVPNYDNNNISALEMQYEGRTFENQPVEERIARLEIKAFGANQSGNIDERLERLNSLARNALNLSSANPAPTYNSSIAGMQGSNFSSSNFSSNWNSDFNDDFFNDSYQNQQITGNRSGFLGFLQNLALPILAGFMNRNNSYTAYVPPYGYSGYNPYYNPYSNPYTYNRYAYNNYVPNYGFNIPGGWNPLYGTSSVTGGPNYQMEYQQALRNNFGVGVHIIP